MRGNRFSFDDNSCLWTVVLYSGCPVFEVQKKKKNGDVSIRRTKKQHPAVVVCVVLHFRARACVYRYSPEMCSAENAVSSKLMLNGVYKLPVNGKNEPLLKDVPEPSKPTKGSSFKQVWRLMFAYTH